VSELLTAVVRLSAATPDPDALLDGAARLLLDRVDWVLADRLDDPDLVTRIAAYDAQGPMTVSYGGWVVTRRSTARTIGLLSVLRATPGKLLRLDRAALEAAAAGEGHAAVQAATALQLGVQELALVGLVARDSLVGVLTLGTATAFTDALLAEVADAALLLGLALDAARLLAVQRAVATAMQTSLLPALPAVPGLLLAARYSPATAGLEVGGDWFDAFPTPAGLVVVVGDASGHDVAAAARMADLRNILRAHAVDRPEPPSALVTRLERTVDVLGLEGTATCVVGRLQAADDGAWELTWTSAGHLPPVLVHRGRAALVTTPPDLLLGVDTAAERTDHVLRLEPGDRLLLFTDGLVEVRDEPLAERLELLRRTVEGNVGGHPDELADALLEAAGTGGGDDVALLVVEVPTTG
jgi:Stage II sporulation protein E (SpoIIE)